tara:strand:+ start:3743 stop:3877 length:135 start_codon:yes stop_codon:yes gene_type:complete
MRQGRFPKGHKLIKGGQAVGWWASDINEYLRELKEDSESDQSEM